MRRKGGKGALPIDNILYVAWSSPPMMAGPKIMAAAIREVLQRWISPFWHSQVTHVCIHKRLGSVGHAYALLDARDIRVSGTTISMTLDKECIGQCNLSA
jgi:hypothetical protein